MLIFISHKIMKTSLKKKKQTNNNKNKKHQQIALRKFYD